MIYNPYKTWVGEIIPEIYPRKAASQGPFFQLSSLPGACGSSAVAPAGWRSARIRWWCFFVREMKPREAIGGFMIFASINGFIFLDIHEQDPGLVGLCRV